MYLVVAIQYDRLISIKAFNQWHNATLYADTLVITLSKGVNKEMLKWEDNDYRNVYEANGVSVMIEPCDAPSDK